jgi:hypothetical protein
LTCEHSDKRRDASLNLFVPAEVTTRLVTGV